MSSPLTEKKKNFKVVESAEIEFISAALTIKSMKGQ